MNDNEIRIAIAEACPFVSDTTDYKSGFMYYKDGTYQEFDPINDLNAIRDAEESVFTNLPWNSGWEKFDTHLLHIAAEAHEHTTTSVIAMLRSTARQRAEAFLRTIGKWKE